MQAILAQLGWLTGYRIVHVVDSGPTRTGDTHGIVRFYVGSEPLPQPTTCGWRADLLQDATYLCQPSGIALLELTPFMRVAHDERVGGSRLFIHRRANRAGEVVMTNPETGSPLSVFVDTPGGELRFADWLDRNDQSYLFVRNELVTRGLAVEDVDRGREPSQWLDGRFEVRDVLGRGGMAVVYRARDDFRGAEVALKVLRLELSNDYQFQERFKREATTMHQLDHPNVLRVLDTGLLLDGRRWLSMPVVEGGSLADHLVDGPPTRDQALMLAEQMLGALVYLHGLDQPIIHRDLKPSNFLLDGSNGLLLTDFGIALCSGDARLTRTREQMGSTAYMSPEQLRGVEEPGPASDVYSLGVILHELFTGETGSLTPGKGVSEPFGSLIREMVATEPDHRPTAREAFDRLSQGGGALGTVARRRSPRVAAGSMSPLVARRLDLLPTAERGRAARWKPVVLLSGLGFAGVLLLWTLLSGVLGPGENGSLTGPAPSSINPDAEAHGLPGVSTPGTRYLDQQTVADCQRFLEVTGGAQSAGLADDLYLLEEGDSLPDLSARFFGDAEMWPRLWSVNPHLTQPHTPVVGACVFFTPGRSSVSPLVRTSTTEACSGRDETIVCGLDFYVRAPGATITVVTSRATDVEVTDDSKNGLIEVFVPGDGIRERISPALDTSEFADVPVAKVIPLDVDEGVVVQIATRGPVEVVHFAVGNTFIIEVDPAR